MKTDAIVVDIDNTIVNSEPIFEEIFTKGLKGSAMWDYFDANCTRDNLEVIQPIVDLVNLYYDFEYEVIKAVDGILNILGIEDTPIFNRNRVSNMKERTEMVMLAANYLDDETIIRKLPFITPDEVEPILAKKLGDDQGFIEAEEV